MKFKRFVVLSVALATVALVLTACTNGSDKTPPAGSNQNVLYYTCPMHPSVKADKPGSCPICNMTLQPVYGSDVATNSPSTNGTAAAKPYPLTTCLVDDMKLGSMGDPYVFVYQGPGNQILLRQLQTRVPQKPGQVSQETRGCLRLQKLTIMKAKWILLLVVIAAIGAGAWWLEKHPLSQPSSTTTADARTPLYYTCAMHPWVHESKPGPCPVCGMNLTPIFATAANHESGTNTEADAGLVTLEPDSISVINVQTDTVERQPVRRTIHLSGEISYNSNQTAWFDFTVYQRDLQWLKSDQTLDIGVTGITDQTLHRQNPAPWRETLC